MTLVMGILNVTPDSFSDGGEYLDPKRAIDRGLEMIDEGATIIDVGGESTKPGADRVSMDEELTRIIPVIHALAKSGALVSVDTMRAEVAALAVASGAKIINDVSGGLADPAMHATAAALKQLESPTSIASRRNRPLEDVAPAAIIRAAAEPSVKVEKTTERAGA